MRTAPGIVVQVQVRAVYLKLLYQTKFTCNRGISEFRL